MFLLGYLPLFSQEYKFSIPSATVDVAIGKDGSALIHYKMTFNCSPGAHPIDIVDIGMPGKSHTAIDATINGKILDEIRTSTYIDNGYEIHLGGDQIPPGGSGIFEFTGKTLDMVYQDTTNKELASFRFSPTWFGAKFLDGTTNMILRFKLPKGDYLNPDKEILWQSGTPQFTLKGIVEGDDSPSVVWNVMATLTGPNLFAVSFPKKNVDNVQSMTTFKLFFKWFSENQKVKFISGIILILIFSFSFFIATRGTGWVLWIILSGILSFLMYNSDMVHLWLYPSLFILAVSAVYFANSGKKHYIPASISREGGNIASSLSPAEASVILDLPSEKIISMIIFDLAAKGFLEIKSHTPLKVNVNGNGRGFDIWALDDGRSLSVKPYEYSFLSAMHKQKNVDVRNMDFTVPMKFLVAQITQATKGTDLEKTRDACKWVASTAWDKVEAQKDPAKKRQMADDNFSWLYVDSDFDRRIDRWHRNGFTYYPQWNANRYMAQNNSSILSFDPKQLSSGQNVSFSDIANSICGQLKNSIASSDLMPKEGGKIDFSKLDEISKTVLSEMSKSGGGGSSGGGCACACAGWACACACAGGGR